MYARTAVKNLTSPSLPANLAPILGALVVFVLAFFARVSYAGNDPELSLLVSQAILDHGSIQLDPYLQARNTPEDNYRILTKNGHYYYYFPIGTSVFATPFVGIANALGYDMANIAEEHETQRILASISSAIVFILVYLICRRYLGPLESTIIGLVSVLGSSLISTLGTALWSHNFTVIFMLMATYLIIHYEQNPSKAPNPYVLGALLFSAYICRPTAIAFIVCVLLYVFLRSKRLFFQTTVAMGGLLLCFFLFSYIAYDQVLPDYYSVSRIQPGNFSVGTAILGLLLSPSRGILVFSPFFAFVLIGLAVHVRRLVTAGLVWFGLAWLGLHIVIVAISGSVPWWGGHSFGSRLLTDSIPALVILTVVVWSHIRQTTSPLARYTVVAIYLFLGAIAVFINSFLGLYNGNTARWNGSSLAPDPGLHQEYLFDWRYPQFLATKQSLCARHSDYMSKQLANQAGQMNGYAWGTTITHASAENQAFFVGWSSPQPDWRWSECRFAAIYFRAEDVDPFLAYALEVHIGSQTPQNVTLLINGTKVGNLPIEDPQAKTSAYRFIIEGALFESNDINSIAFDIPGANSLIGDPRTLGIVFAQFKIEPSPSPDTVWIPGLNTNHW